MLPAMSAPSICLPELLAPAGGPDAAFAAFRYGADAIFLGLPNFSARAEAQNFTWESLGEVVAFAHAQQKRRNVYVAFNTLVLTRELDDALRSLERLAELGVDALIVQDLGVARMVRRHFPTLALHASTQMATHNAAGARALGRLGFTRVVLARELPIEETGDVVRNGGLEVEAFIHGTLCYSYSGMCLFSSHATGRSGNRGRCSYSCRTTFGAGDRETMPFSMKDLALGDRLTKLREAGVTSLKIEGRMKSALYVSAVTDYYRKLLDGSIRDDERKRLEEDLQTIFSRPWTRLHADGPASAEAIIDSQTVGHRGAPIGKVARLFIAHDGDWLIFESSRALELHDGLQIDLPGQTRPYGFAVDVLRPGGRRETVIQLPAGARVEVRLPEDHPTIPEGSQVYCSSSQEVKRRYPVEHPRPGVHRCRHPLRVSIQLRAGSLVVRGETEIARLGTLSAEEKLDGTFSAARQRDGTLAAAKKAFERLGDTDWTAASVDLDDPDGLFVPASIWNEARRRLAVALDAAREKAREETLATLLATDAVAPPETESAEQWSLNFDSVPADWTAEDWAGVTDIVLPLALVAMMPDKQSVSGIPLRIGIPVLLRGTAISMASKRVAALLAAGVRRWEVSSLAGLELLNEEARSAGLEPSALDLTSDWSVYVLNPQAAEAGRELGFHRFVTSPEDDGENLTALLREQGHRALVLLMQFSPLFEAETAPALPAQLTQLRGRRGERYIELHEEHAHVLISTSPFSLVQQLDRLRAASARGFRVDFRRATAAKADLRGLWRSIRSGEAIADSHQGNFVRGLQ